MFHIWTWSAVTIAAVSINRWISRFRSFDVGFDTRKLFTHSAWYHGNTVTVWIIWCTESSYLVDRYMFYHFRLCLSTTVIANRFSSHPFFQPISWLFYSIYMRHIDVAIIMLATKVPLHFIGFNAVTILFTLNIKRSPSGWSNQSFYFIFSH